MPGQSPASSRQLVSPEEKKKRKERGGKNKEKNGKNTVLQPYVPINPLSQLEESIAIVIASGYRNWFTRSGVPSIVYEVIGPDRLEALWNGK